MPNSNLNQLKIELSVSALLNPKNLNALSEENQKEVISTAKDIYTKEKEGGFLGKILGTNKTNLSMHIALILCVILIIVGCCIKDTSIKDKIFTLLATIVGYIFGTTQKES